MIRSFECPRATEFFSYLLSKEILDLKPVIAGGSAVAAYKACQFYDTDAKWNFFIKKGGIWNNKNTDICFGDIDFWFLEEQIESQPYKTLVKDYNDGKYLDFKGSRVRTIEERTQEEASTVNALDSLGNEFFTFKPHKHDMGITTKELNLVSSLGLDFNYVSRWSNTYSFLPEIAKKNQDTVFGKSVSNRRDKIQFIRKPIRSIEHLLDQFDFISCCAAYHDGKLYIKDGLDQSFDMFEIFFNNQEAVRGDVPLAQRTLCAIRAFKYSKRYALTFSPEVADFVFKVFLESFNHQKQEKAIKYTPQKYGIPFSNLANIQPPAQISMGALIQTQDTEFEYQDYNSENLEILMSRLHQCFEVFQDMNTFRPEYLPYFLNCKVSYIENLVQKKMNHGIDDKTTILNW